ncbi:MAG TPA: 4-hydroxy-tetrahydrodipicolinate synthase [Candidatus Limnocylindria bacterium]|nr:4-hydroxy-tetrahydrodipicolinate synthase [Candidatus Limnocylindria bacterium]
MRHNFQGAITALVTPFTSKNEVDVEALRQLVDFQLANGIDGLVPCGSTGEASTLTEAEYRLVVETVASEAHGRVPVIAGAGTNDTAKAVHLSQIAKQAGADALLHVTPYYNKPTPSGLIAHFSAIAGSGDLPIIAYNIPGRTGSNVSAETMLRLIKEVPQIIGVKEASGDIVQQMNIIAGAPPEFVLLAGDDAFTLPVIAIGGKGVISATTNEIPGPFSELVHAAQAGDLAKARKLHYQWLDLMHANFIETNPIPVKSALAMMGKITQTLRLPLTPMEEQNRQALERVLKGHELL